MQQGYQPPQYFSFRLTLLSRKSFLRVPFNSGARLQRAKGKQGMPFGPASAFWDTRVQTCGRHTALCSTMDAFSPQGNHRGTELLQHRWWGGGGCAIKAERSMLLVLPGARTWVPFEEGILQMGTGRLGGGWGGKQRFLGCGGAHNGIFFIAHQIHFLEETRWERPLTPPSIASTKRRYKATKIAASMQQE